MTEYLSWDVAYAVWSTGLLRRERVPLADLADEPWIVADDPDAIAALRARCEAAGFDPRTPLRVAEWISKLGLVAEGFGVTLVPALAAAAMARDGVVLRAAPRPRPRSGRCCGRRRPG